MGTHKIICGHVIPILKTLPDEHVDMLMTSVPYWGLRDYGEDTVTIWGGDKDCEHDFVMKNYQKINLADAPEPSGLRKKQENIDDEGRAQKKFQHSSGFCSLCGAWRGQLGLEETPEEYINHLRMVFAGVKRVLKKTGTCWVNIGDTYAGSGCGKNDYRNNNKRSASNPMLYCDKDNPQLNTDLPAKCMCMIPERFAFMMLDLGYILRNKIIWRKQNPMPSSVKDRFNTTYEMLYFFSKSQKYWFDLDAIRKPCTEPLNRWGGDEVKIPEKTKGKSDDEKAKWCMSIGDRQSRPNSSGKNPGDVIEMSKEEWLEHCIYLWGLSHEHPDFFNINTQPFAQCHFAVFPEKLVEKPLAAGCPAEVCKYCGMARMRITETEALEYKGIPYTGGTDFIHHGKDKSTLTNSLIKRKTIIWTDCPCSQKDKYEPGIIIDPFAGSGTVGIVAEKSNRNSILVDIKRDYCEMALKRLKLLADQTKLSGKQSKIIRIGF